MEGSRRLALEDKYLKVCRLVPQGSLEAAQHDPATEEAGVLVSHLTQDNDLQFPVRRTHLTAELEDIERVMGENQLLGPEDDIAGVSAQLYSAACTLQYS